MERLRRETHNLLDKLKLSAPFASMRYQGHMLWDQALPATIGQFAAGLYNQNNVAAEASPVTTRLEVEVGNDLCRMLGYATDPDPGSGPPIDEGQIVGWGHITSGGTVANIEALWAARNLKFAGVGLRAAIREVPLLSAARSLEVPLWGGQKARLIDLDTWTLLNLDLDTLAGLPAALAGFGIAPDAATEALAGYTLQNVGLIGFYRSFMPDLPEPPVFLVAATGHYSWPKAATLIGLGQNACLVQRVDGDARLDLDHVEVTLSDLLRRRTPVLGVVAVIGSTEESAVDPLTRPARPACAVPGAGPELRRPCRRRVGRLFPRHAARRRRPLQPGHDPDHADERLRPHTIRGAGRGRQHHRRPAQGRLHPVSCRRAMLPQLDLPRRRIVAGAGGVP